MNLSHVQWELAEAIIHLQALVTGIREGRFQPEDTSELGVEMGHILDHMCYAWNGHPMTFEELQGMPQSEFERLCNTVPNFGATRVMGDVA